MGRVMAFIDGENLTARFEAMLKDGLPPYDSTHLTNVGVVKHLPGKFAWSPHTIKGLILGDVLERVYYYTTFSGAEQELDEFSATVGECKAWDFPRSDLDEVLHRIRLIPRVFKKSVRKTKTKSVDISLCAEVLECVKNNALDAVYLVSGDIDYRPLIEAVMRAGKRVYVASLSSGRAPHLPNIPDRYVDLDSVYFKRPSSLDKYRKKK